MWCNSEKISFISAMSASAIILVWEESKCTGQEWKFRKIWLKILFFLLIASRDLNISDISDISSHWNASIVNVRSRLLNRQLRFKLNDSKQFRHGYLSLLSYRNKRVFFKLITNLENGRQWAAAMSSIVRFNAWTKFIVL